MLSLYPIKHLVSTKKKLDKIDRFQLNVALIILQNDYKLSLLSSPLFLRNNNYIVCKINTIQKNQSPNNVEIS